jgi:hypothetical protein
MAESRERATGAPERRESGQPGGGQGRTDQVGPTGVYPGSGPYPEGPAEVRTPGDFVHGQVDEQGRPVEGGSEITFIPPETAIGGTTPPPSGAPSTPKSQPPDQAPGS